MGVASSWLQAITDRFPAPRRARKVQPRNDIGKWQLSDAGLALEVAGSRREDPLRLPSDDAIDPLGAGPTETQVQTNLCYRREEVLRRCAHIS